MTTILYANINEKINSWRSHDELYVSNNEYRHEMSNAFNDVYDECIDKINACKTQDELFRYMQKLESVCSTKNQEFKSIAAEIENLNKNINQKNLAKQKELKRNLEIIGAEYRAYNNCRGIIYNELHDYNYSKVNPKHDVNNPGVDLTCKWNDISSEEKKHIVSEIPIRIDYFEGELMLCDVENDKDAVILSEDIYYDFSEKYADDVIEKLNDLDSTYAVPECVNKYSKYFRVGNDDNGYFKATSSFPECSFLSNITGGKDTAAIKNPGFYRYTFHATLESESFTTDIEIFSDGGNSVDDIFFKKWYNYDTIEDAAANDESYVKIMRWLSDLAEDVMKCYNKMDDVAESEFESIRSEFNNKAHDLLMKYLDNTNPDVEFNEQFYNNKFGRYVTAIY